MTVSWCNPCRTRRGVAGTRAGRRLSGRLVALAIGLQLAGAGTLAAQGLIAGTVTDRNTHQPVPGAQIVVQGTQLGALSNSDGRFRIRGATGTVSLVARRIGYASQTKSVTAGATTVVFELEERATLNVIPVARAHARVERGHVVRVLRELGEVPLRRDRVRSHAEPTRAPVHVRLRCAEEAVVHAEREISEVTQDGSGCHESGFTALRRISRGATRSPLPDVDALSRPSPESPSPAR